MTFGRDMTQIRPKNPLKKALPKAVLPKSSDKHSQDVGNLFPTFFLTGTCERKNFLSPFSLRCEKNFFLSRVAVKKVDYQHSESVYQKIW